jgi:methylated-DNA-[protein]-cysteine S-methyltransferase
MTTFFAHFQSPVGTLLLMATERGLSGLHMEKDSTAFQNASRDGVRDDARFSGINENLNEYFSGRRKEFDVPIDLRGTPFQISVWNALRTIPFGATISYAELARRIGNPKAVRAVGQANNRNPISIIVPCHRVIGADGSLTGYGGGIERKRFLIELEAGAT